VISLVFAVLVIDGEAEAGHAYVVPLFSTLDIHASLTAAKHLGVPLVVVLGLCVGGNGDNATGGEGVLNLFV
jgi:hypothetical protein